MVVNGPGRSACFSEELICTVSVPSFQSAQIAGTALYFMADFQVDRLGFEQASVWAEGALPSLALWGLWLRAFRGLQMLQGT
jgi:hypothetical protein